MRAFHIKMLSHFGDQQTKIHKTRLIKLPKGSDIPIIYTYVNQHLHNISFHNYWICISACTSSIIRKLDAYVCSYLFPSMQSWNNINMVEAIKLNPHNSSHGFGSTGWGFVVPRKNDYICIVQWYYTFRKERMGMTF